jgi:hypothetical protein
MIRGMSVSNKANGRYLFPAGVLNKYGIARARFLKMQTHCALCKKELGSGVRVLDHIVPHRGNHQLFLDVRNFQAVHKRCHDSVKARLEHAGVGNRYREEVRTGDDGYPLDVEVPRGMKRLPRGEINLRSALGATEGGRGEKVAAPVLPGWGPRKHLTVDDGDHESPEDSTSHG